MGMVLNRVKVDLAHRISARVDSIHLPQFAPTRLYKVADALYSGVASYLSPGLIAAQTTDARAVQYLYDSALTRQLHPVEPNSERVILTSAARTVQTDSTVQMNLTKRGVLVILSVTAASGTGGLTLALQAHDPINTDGTASWVSIAQATTAKTASGIYTYMIYPGASGGAVTQAISLPVPRTYRIRVGVGDASSYTYSVSVSTLF